MFKLILLVFLVQNILTQNGSNISDNLNIQRIKKDHARPKIASGINIFNDKKPSFPWTVSIQKRNQQHLCGGSIITGRHVLTVAHCLDRQPVYQIMAGTDNLNKAEKLNVYIIEKKILHPKWNMETVKNDIGIIVTTIEMVFNDNVRAICMLELYPNLINETVTIVGWGLMWENETVDKDINQLKEAKSWIKDSSDCRKHGQGLISTYYKSLYCAVLGTGVIMPGDSGSPVMTYIPRRRAYYLVGAVSESDDVSFAHFLFISANFYLDWMNNVTSQINEKLCIIEKHLFNI